MCDIPCASTKSEPSYSFLDEFMFLISTTDPWYGDFLVYPKTQIFHPIISRDDRRRICHHAKYYLILNDTLYRHGIDYVLWWCLTHEEAEKVLNDCHYEACGYHLSWMATAQKILRASYLWPSVFKDFHEAIKKWSPCQHFYLKKRTHPAPLHPVIVIGLFPNGELIIWIVSLPQPGGMVTSS